MGEIRFLAQAQNGADAWAYTIMYLGLVVLTIMFTYQYIRRVLYMAFYTMISPLVAITYPIDKLGDGKSQAFNMWFKEYMMNMILQPIHLILYTMIVGSAISLSVENPIFGIIALIFLLSAEKFIKQLFGVNPQADKGFGGLAASAALMAGLNKLAHSRPHGNSGGGNGSRNNTEEDEENTRITQQNTNPLASFASANNNSQNTNINNDNENDDVDNGWSPAGEYISDNEEENPVDEWSPVEDYVSDSEEDNNPVLDAYDDNYGTDDWKPQERDAVARDTDTEDNGMPYDDEEYEQILRDSGYSEDEIADMMKENNNDDIDNQEEKNPFDEWSPVGEDVSDSEEERNPLDEWNPTEESRRRRYK